MISDREIIQKLFSPHLEVLCPLWVEPVPQFKDHLVEDDRVDLLAQLHQDEPVAEPELLHHNGNVAPIRRLRASTEDEVAGISGEDSDHPEAEEDTGPES